MSLASGWRTASLRRFDCFDGSGNDAIGSVMVWDPVPNKLAAGVLRPDANVVKACIAQHGFEFVNARGSGDASAKRGEVGCDLGRDLGSAYDVGDRDPSSWL